METLMQRQVLRPNGHDRAFPFAEVLDLVGARAARARPVDRYARLSRFGFFAGDGHNGLIEPKKGEHGPAGLQAYVSDHAFGQLAARVGPTNGSVGYLRACPPRLRTLNVNWWLQNNAPQEDALLRVVQGNYSQESNVRERARVVRAVLSGRFQPFDDLDLIRALEGLPSIDEAVVRWCDVNDLTTHVRLTWPEDRVELRVGDVVERGVHISNSEVGARSVRIQPLVFRLVCTNGMLAPKKLGGYAIRHVGNGDRVRQLVGEAIDDVFGATEELIDKFRQALTVAVDQPVDELTALAKAGSLTEAQFRATLDSYLLEAEPTRFGIANAITLAAQGQDDPINRTGMEALAGRYVSGMRLPAVTDEDRERVTRLAA